MEPIGETSTFTGIVHDLHVRLPGGQVGRWVAVISTALSMVILVTGLFL